MVEFPSVAFRNWSSSCWLETLGYLKSISDLSDNVWFSVKVILRVREVIRSLTCRRHVLRSFPFTYKDKNNTIKSKLWYISIPDAFTVVNRWRIVLFFWNNFYVTRTFTVVNRWRIVLFFWNNFYVMRTFTVVNRWRIVLFFWNNFYVTRKFTVVNRWRIVLFFWNNFYVMRTFTVVNRWNILMSFDFPFVRLLGVR